MAALLVRREMIKKDNHGKNCHDQGKHFSQFVLSVDGMIGREVLVVHSQLSRVMAVKSTKPLLQVRGG